MSTEKLSLVEQADLSKLEKVISTGMKQFCEVGAALSIIKERRLYRMKFKTFEDYCKVRWEFTRQRAYQLIEAYVVTQQLPPNLSNKFDKASAAAALAKVPADIRLSTAENVVKSGKRVTAKAIEDEADKNKGKVPTGGSTPGAAQAVIILDEVSYPVPPELVPLWERGNEVGHLLAGLMEVRRITKQALADNDPLYAEVNNSVLSDLTNALNTLRLAIPYAVCPKCQGRKEVTKNCTTCKKRGLVSKFFWDRCVTPEDKKIRSNLAERKAK